MLGLPSLAYDIFLYKSKTKLELISNESQLKFFEDGIRGGLSFASERLQDTRVSGKSLFHWVSLYFLLMHSLLVKFKKKKIPFQDINNLYGGSQAEALPKSDYKWHPNPKYFMNPKVIEAMKPDVSYCSLIRVQR